MKIFSIFKYLFFLKHLDTFLRKNKIEAKSKNRFINLNAIIMKRDKVNLNELKITLKEKYQKQLDRNHTNQRKILRNKRQVKFQDYNLVRMKKNYHIEINPLPTNINFITLPETYNTKILHTHDLKIYYENKLVEPLESNNKKLVRLNHKYRIFLSGQVHEKITKCFENVDQLKISKKEKEGIKRLKRSYLKYFEELRKFYSSEYGLYIKDKVSHEYSEEKFIKYEKELNKEKEKVKKHFLKKDQGTLNYIADLYNEISLFIESRYEQLVAIELPNRDLKLKKKFHRDITIETEEPYLGCALIRRPFKNIFLGESAKFLMQIHRHKNASTYYEVYPPKDTRISKINSTSEDISNCNILMLNLSNPIKKNLTLNFNEKFDERFVVHIPRENARKNIPNFYLTLRPLKMAQFWIFISLFLGFVFFLFMLFLIINHFCGWFNINILLFIDIFRYIIPLIYGLIVGNRLWYQKPEFLWRTTTPFSIFIILSGVICYCVFLFII